MTNFKMNSKYYITVILAQQIKIVSNSIQLVPVYKSIKQDTNGAWPCHF